MSDPDDIDIDLSALRGDLRDMEWSGINRWELFEQGRELEKAHAMGSEVELEVPLPVADHVRAVVRETATMSVEERHLHLFEALIGFERWTTRYIFPKVDILEAGPDRTVLTPASVD